MALSGGSSCHTIGCQSIGDVVFVFLCSNFFKEDLEEYYNAVTLPFCVPTTDTIEITKAALKIVDIIFKPGIRYKKSGVILGKIVRQSSVQPDLFDPVQNRAERLDLSQRIDSLNQKYGLKTIALGVEGEKQQPWKVKSEHKSYNYLTDINEILTINI